MSTRSATSNIRLRLAATLRHQTDDGWVSSVNVGGWVLLDNLASGIETGQANRAWEIEISLPGGSSQTGLYLTTFQKHNTGAGLSRDGLGQLLTMEEIVAIAIVNKAGPGWLEVNNPAGGLTTEVDWIPTLKMSKGNALKPGGAVLFYQPDTDAFDVDVGTNDLLHLRSRIGAVTAGVYILGRHDDEASSSSSSTQSGSSLSTSSTLSTLSSSCSTVAKSTSSVTASSISTASCQTNSCTTASTLSSSCVSISCSSLMQSSLSCTTTSVSTSTIVEQSSSCQSISTQSASSQSASSTSISSSTVLELSTSSQSVSTQSASTLSTTSSTAAKSTSSTVGMSTTSCSTLASFTSSWSTKTSSSTAIFSHSTESTVALSTSSSSTSSTVGLSTTSTQSESTRSTSSTIALSTSSTIAECTSSTIFQSTSSTYAQTTSTTEDTWTPALPQSYVDTTCSLPVGGTTWYVNGEDDLQGYLDRAEPGDVIVLEAGATWTGNYTISARAGTGDIYVISSALASLPEGVRVGPADAANMPKITCLNAYDVTLQIAPEASNWRFCGIEIASDYDLQTGVQYGILRVGWNSGDIFDLDPADNIIFDRCLIHGTATGNNRDGVVVYHVSNFAIVDSYISDFHGVGYESHGIHLFSPTGPVEIRNNYVEAGGINIFIGDSTLPADAPTPSDLRIRNNYLFKPLTWDPNDPSYAGISWGIKNLFESKGSTRLLVESNILENSWSGSQLGQVFVMTPRARPLLDTTIRYNLSLHAASFMAVSSPEEAQPITRFLYEQNLVYTTRVDQYGQGGVTIFIAGWNYGTGIVDYLTIRHNTHINTAGIFIFFNGSYAQPDQIPHLRAYDNLVTHGAYGLLGNDAGVGYPSITHYCIDFDVQGTVWIGGIPGYHLEYPDYGQHSLPADNAAVGFVDDTFDNIPGDFALDAGSDYKGAATDNTDPGANIALLPAYS